MKKYKFRLANVLRIRMLQEEQAKAKVLLANSEVARARVVVAARKDHANEYLAKQAHESAMRSSAADYAAFRALQRLAFDGVVYAQGVQAEKEEIADLRKEEWLEEKRKVQMLERLDERRREEHRLDAQREELLEVDDIVVSRFGRDR